MASIVSEFLSEERSSLIQRLSSIPGLRYLDSATHAMIWLSDIEALQKTVGELESGSFLRSATISGLKNPAFSMPALKAWLARPQRKNEIPHPTDPASTPALAESPKTPQKRKFGEGSRSPSKLPRLKKRSKPAKDIANERDGGRCVVTKMGEPIQVCHIYPFALGNKPKSERESFWILLGSFWSPETIAKWKEQIMGPQDTEVPQNLLCLSTIVHDLWGSARLAFEPVEMSEDKTFLTMRFWWLPLRTFSRHVDLQVAPSLSSDLKASPRNAKLWNCDTDELIYSGQLVTMTTKDPEAMPLPSFDLLQIQWVLNRIAALSGAADVADEEFEDFERFGGSVIEPLPLELVERSRREPSSRENEPPDLPHPKTSSKIREIPEETSDDAFSFIDT